MGIFSKKTAPVATSEEEPFPKVPAALVKYLIKRFPPRCISKRETHEAHLRYAGTVDLILKLAVEADKQNPGELDLDEYEVAALREWENEEGVTVSEVPE